MFKLKSLVLTVIILASAGSSHLRAGALHDLVQTNNLQGLAQLLEEKNINPVNMEELDNQGKTPLICACLNDFSEATWLLISNGANVNALCLTEPNTGITPLLLACSKNNTKIAELLIKKGANVNAAYTTGLNAGATILLLACSKNNTKIANLLIQKGADVNSSSTAGPNIGITPLIWASKKNNTEIANLLIQKGASIDAAPRAGPNIGITPLIWACAKNNLEIVKLLIKEGANVNALCLTGPNAGITPLLLACSKNNTEIAELLIKKGADVNSSYTTGPNIGITPLFLACKKHNVEIVRLLIQKGASVNALLTTGPNAGKTPLKIIFTDWAPYLQTKLFQSLIPTKTSTLTNPDQTSFLSLIVSPAIAKKYNPNIQATLAIQPLYALKLHNVDEQKELVKICKVFFSNFFTIPHVASMPKDLLSQEENTLSLKRCDTTPFDWALKYRLKMTKEQFENLNKLLFFAKAAHQKYFKKTDLSDNENEFKKQYERLSDIAIRFSALPKKGSSNKRKLSKRKSSFGNKKKRLLK